jgi:hypothetical protein
MLLLLVACDSSGSGSPRSRVLEFVRLVQADTLPEIEPYVEIELLSQDLYGDAQFDSLSDLAKQEKLLFDFSGQGRYRRMLTESQIVVNTEEFLSDSLATVEVSYIDRGTRIQYYTKMLLIRRDDVWLIQKLRVQ